MHDGLLANKFGALLVALSDRVEAGFTPYSPSSAAALFTLLYRGQTPLTELARVLCLSQPAATRLVDKLVDAGLVARVIGPGRVVPVCLTPAGEDAARSLQARRLAACTGALDVLDDADKGALDRLLSTVLAGLVEGRRHARQVCRLCDHATCDGPLCPVGCAARALEAQQGRGASDAVGT